MKLSVCIPSYNPTLTLSRTIDYLIPQKGLMYQLVIVIDSDKYSAQVKELQNKYSGIFNLSVIMQANTGRAGARNRCVKEATGEVVLFLDDDVAISKDLVKRHIEYHKSESNCIVSGNAFRDESQAKDDFSKYVVEVEKNWQKGMPEKGQVRYDNFAFTVCNMSIPVKLFNELGGFDTRLKDAEDFDFAMRALGAGIKIMYDRSLLAWPTDWPDIKTYINRHNTYIRANCDLVKLHPEYLKSFPDLVPAEAVGIKKVILGILRSSICKLALNDSLLFRALSLKMKFALYRLTIAANSVSNQ